LVIAVFIALLIRVPIDAVSISLTLFQTWLAMEGEILMMNCKDMVVCGAHGVASLILWKPQE